MKNIQIVPVSYRKENVEYQGSIIFKQYPNGYTSATFRNAQNVVISTLTGQAKKIDELSSMMMEYIDSYSVA